VFSIEDPIWEKVFPFESVGCNDAVPGYLSEMARIAEPFSVTIDPDVIDGADVPYSFQPSECAPSLAHVLPIDPSPEAVSAVNVAAPVPVIARTPEPDAILLDNVADPVPVMLKAPTPEAVCTLALTAPVPVMGAAPKEPEPLAVRAVKEAAPVPDIASDPEPDAVKADAETAPVPVIPAAPGSMGPGTP
jgi:hypothetical protein